MPHPSPSAPRAPPPPGVDGPSARVARPGARQRNRDMGRSEKRARSRRKCAHGGTAAPSARGGAPRDSVGAGLGGPPRLARRQAPGPPLPAARLRSPPPARASIPASWVPAPRLLGDRCRESQLGWQRETPPAARVCARPTEGGALARPRAARPLRASPVRPLRAPGPGREQERPTAPAAELGGGWGAPAAAVEEGGTPGHVTTPHRPGPARAARPDASVHRVCFPGPRPGRPFGWPWHRRAGPTQGPGGSGGGGEHPAHRPHRARDPALKAPALGFCGGGAGPRNPVSRGCTRGHPCPDCGCLCPGEGTRHDASPSGGAQGPPRPAGPPPSDRCGRAAPGRVPSEDDGAGPSRPGGG